METLNFLVKFFQDGGFWMYPITLVLGVGFAIAFERYSFLTKASKQNSELWDKIIPVVQKGDYVAATKLASEHAAPIGHVLNYGLNQRKSSTHREDIETALEEGLMEVIPKIEKRTHYIATYANIATLLGLLGTVVGLIQAFVAVANAAPSEKANLLSAAISVAMNTTAYGLIVAIPLVLIYSVVQSKTTEVVDALEMACVKFTNLISDVNIK